MSRYDFLYIDQARRDEEWVHRSKFVRSNFTDIDRCVLSYRGLAEEFPLDDLVLKPYLCMRMSWKKVFLTVGISTVGLLYRIVAVYPEAKNEFRIEMSDVSPPEFPEALKNKVIWLLNAGLTKDLLEYDRWEKSSILVDGAMTPVRNLIKVPLKLLENGNPTDHTFVHTGTFQNAPFFRNPENAAYIRASAK